MWVVCAGTWLDVSCSAGPSVTSAPGRESSLQERLVNKAALYVSWV